MLPVVTPVWQNAPPSVQGILNPRVRGHIIRVRVCACSLTHLLDFGLVAFCVGDVFLLYKVGPSGGVLVCLLAAGV